MTIEQTPSQFRLKELLGGIVLQSNTINGLSIHLQTVRETGRHSFILTATQRQALIEWLQQIGDLPCTNSHTP